MWHTKAKGECEMTAEVISYLLSQENEKDKDSRYVLCEVL